MNIDDPKLTAYALGELSAAERAEIEKQLRDDPEARAFVEETAAFGAMLGNAFHAEHPPVELAPEQRSKIIQQATPKIVPFRSERFAWQAGVGALAASLAIAILFTWSMGPLAAPKLADVSRKETPVLNGMVAASAPAPLPESLTLAPMISLSLDQSNSVAMLDSKKSAPAAAPSLPASTTIVGSGGKVFIAGASQSMGSLQNANTYTGTTTVTAGTLVVSAAPATPAITEEVSLARPVAKAKTIQADRPASSAYTDSLNETAPAASLALRGSDRLASSGQVVAMENKTSVMGRSAPAAPELSSADARRQLSRPEKAKNIKGESFTQTALAPTSTVAFTSGSGDFIADLRRLIQSGQRPPPNSIPVDALVNAFQNGPGNAPLETEVARCPWNNEHRLLCIRVKTAPPASRLNVDFGPDRVEAYRLIGGQLPNKNSQETAIRLGSDPSVTILYEIVPTRITATLSQRLATVRATDPARQDAKPVEQIVLDHDGSISAGSADFQLAATAAEFGRLLNDSKEMANWEHLEHLAVGNHPQDKADPREKLLELIRAARAIYSPVD